MSLMSGAGVQAIRWSALFFVSAIFVYVLESAHLPAALLLGPMLAAILFAGFEKQVAVPPTVGLMAQGVIGCMIATTIPLSILGELARDWPLFLAGVVSVVVAACSLGLVLAKLQVLPGTTAIWGSFPGAASAMTIMADSFGADMRLVAFMQYLRVVCVSVVASTIARIWVGHSGTPLPAMVWFPPVDWLALAGTLLLIVASFFVTRWFKIAAGIFLLPMIAGIVLQNTGLMKIELPPWLLAASYALVGWTIGLRFTRPILAHAARALPRVLGSILALMAICGVFAVALVYFAGIDPLTAYLATSPGGADSVAIISASSNVDIPFVMAMQLARFLVILIAGPAIARLVVKWSGLRDATRAPLQ
jgi:membrane AbrB-like protein